MLDRLTRYLPLLVSRAPPPTAPRYRDSALPVPHFKYVTILLLVHNLIPLAV